MKLSLLMLISILWLTSCTTDKVAIYQHGYRDGYQAGRIAAHIDMVIEHYEVEVSSE